ncbi:MAG: hypothetical protein JW801_07665 [Bacteroidales bacterium]|nr:hypothetical protein [Bacteroidales bacterium]
MKNNTPKAFYEEKTARMEGLSHRLKKRLRWITFLRLISFLLIFPAVFVVLPKMLVPGLVLAFVFLIAFLLLIKVHLKKDREYRHIQELLLICRHEMESLEYRFGQYDPGEEYVDNSHSFSYDMDLFGEGSVFQFLNRTGTQKGKDYFAGLLHNETLDPVLIKRRQEAVKELSLMHDLVQDFQASGRMSQEKEEDQRMLQKWLEEPNYYASRKVYPYLAFALPAFTFLSIVAAILDSTFIALPIILYFTQFILVGNRMKHTNRQHQVLSKRLDSLRKYYSLLSVVETGKYKSAELSELYAVLISDEHSASRSIQSLAKIVSAFDNRLNILAAIFLQGLLLWDIQCMLRLERWKIGQGSRLNDWINAISRFDALASLSTFTFNHPDFVFPTPDPENYLKAEEMGHILISPEERVCNDFEILSRGSFILVTGANMAGKSTFLRTVATNLILAMAGAPVCAKSMRFKPCSLYSSMRTSDSLNKHESYFYAELKRLKELLDRLHRGEELFIILDEILKGTNSTDKQKGSRAALEQIIDLRGTGIIATHDLELANIEKQYPDRVRNLCFEIDIDKARISFDYKLREGITTRMNALLLMKQMGIIRDQEEEREK